MLTMQEEILLADLPKTEYGRALFKWLKEEIGMLENKEQHAAKICDDPLIEDFRCQLGIKIGLKRVLDKPQECIKSLNNKGE